MTKYRKKAVVFTSILVLTMLVLSACSPEGTQQEPLEPFVLTDGMGREVLFEAHPGRILSLAPSATEILFAIGAGDLVIGRDEPSDYPPEAVELPSIGSTYGDLNTEAIVALEPDLVVAAMINSPEHVQAIEDLGIAVYVLPNPMNFPELFRILETAGKITGRESQSAALVAALQARVEAVVERLVDVDPVRVYYEVDGMDSTAPWTVGAGTFQDVLITLCGGENIAADMEFYMQLSLEEIVVRDPQMMIFSQSVWVTTTPESVAERPGWSAISAVAEGRVYGIDANWLDRPGPRLVDALEAMAAVLHPERFE